MLLVKTANGQVEQFPYTLGDLRRDNPNVSFPKQIGDAILAQHGIFHVMPESQPECDHMVQTVVRDEQPRKETRIKQEEDLEPEEVNVGDTYETGRWVIGYTVVNKPIDQASDNVRAHRGHLLSETDWVVAMSYERGEAVPEAWANYRQALRDVPDQEGFPYNVVWPTKPE